MTEEIIEMSEEEVKTEEEVVETEETKEEVKVDDSVSSAEVKKLMAELNEAKREAELAKTELKGKEIEQMKAGERWKEIAELREKEANQYKEQYESMSNAVSKDRKMNAIRQSAQAAGIRSEAFDDLDLYDFPEVQVETTSTGSARVVGAKEAVDALKAKKPHWFSKPSSSLNSSSPGVVDGGKITVEQIRKAQAQYGKTKSRDDLSTYNDLMIKYKKQG